LPTARKERARGADVALDVVAVAAVVVEVALAAVDVL